MKVPPARQLISRASYEVRRRAERVDNSQVRHARQLLRAVRGDPPDVLYVGESTVSLVAPYDSDRRRLCVMVDDALGPRVSTFAVHGASYHAELLADYLTLLEPLKSRPVLIVPLWVRGRYPPWIEHPVFGHRQAMRFIRQIAAEQPAWRVRASFPRPRQADFDAYYRVAHPTLIGELTVGDYVRPLKDPEHYRGREQERVKLLHAYHQGAALRAGSPELAAVERLGRVVGKLGCEAVVYQTPVPVESGVECLGAEFAELATRNFTVLDDAFRAGLGRDVDIIQSGTIFTSAEFIDVRGADEHLNQAGRRRLANLIAADVSRALVRRDGSSRSR